MVLVSLVWLQAAPLSKTVIAVASLLFVLAIVLVVYFVRKLRAGSKVDEDWTLSRSSLFVEPPKESDAEPAPATEMLATPEPIEAMPGETRLLASDGLAAEPPAPAGPAPTLEIAAPPKTSEAPPATELLVSRDPTPPARDERHTQLFSSPPPLRKERATEVLSSLPPEAPEPVRAPQAPVADAPTADLATPFDEEVWAGLDAPSPAAPPPPSDATRELRSPAAVPPPPTNEPLSTARVEQRPPRAPFEPPIVEPLHQQRAAFEPPVINPITPREQTALLGAQPPADRDSYATDAPPRPPADRPAAAQRDAYSQPPPPEPTAPLYSDSPGRDERLAGLPTPRVPERDRPDGGQLWDAASVAPAGRASSAHKPAGAVLGLPREMSQAPLVLGTPAKSREEIGIGSLTGYGKVDKEGGRGGFIALVVALVIFGGAALAYFFVPAVHDRVNERIARARGLDPNEQNSTQPKAMIFPSNTPETDKNTVHAKGAVQNISSETLENLTLEVQLNKSGGETSMLSVSVTPAQLGPNEQGAYNFDYDGKGVTSYTIKRLLSNNKETRFSAPGLKQ